MMAVVVAPVSMMMFADVGGGGNGGEEGDCVAHCLLCHDESDEHNVVAMSGGVDNCDGGGCDVLLGCIVVWLWR